MSLYKLISKKSEYNYDKKVTNRCLVVMRKSTTISQQKRDELLIELFLNCSSIVLKSINNFKFLVKDVPKSKIIHSNEDIVNECFIVIHRCVINMRWEDLNKFHFFYNSALNRVMFRIFERQYKKHLNVLENTEENEYKTMNTKSLSHVDFFDFECEKYNFTEIELKLVKMKTEGHNFQEFLKENKMSHATYKSVMESIKLKISNMYKDDQFPDSE